MWTVKRNGLYLSDSFSVKWLLSVNDAMIFTSYEAALLVAEKETTRGNEAFVVIDPNKFEANMIEEYGE